MSHNIALSRQLRRDPIKTGGIIINPEDALPSMRDNIHVLKDGTHYVQLKPADQHNKDFQSREFRYEFGGRRRQQRDLVKTGGILINPEDALPSMRDQIHTAKNGTTFALLKPYNQRPHTGSSSNSQAQTFERNFEYEFIPTSSFAQGRNDVVKTGGILINPEDALPSMRNSLHALRSGDYCALLKPWSQLQAEKSEGRGTSRSEGTRKFSHELTLTRPNRERDVVKTGGIIINPEDALPSMRDSIHVLKNGAHYVQLKPWDQFQAERAQASRRSSGKRLEGGRRFSLELTRNPIKEDRVKTGGIIINPEDALPSMRHSIHVLPKSGAHYVNLRTWGQVRDEQGGHIHVPPSQPTESTNNEPYVSRQGELRELPREQPQVEPVKTGGIVINPRDVLAEKRGELNFVPNSNTVYANLKPWSKIQKEQGGVVHAKKIKASYDQENMGENVPSLENIDTKTTLKSLDSRLDSILMRSRSFLSEPSINDVQAARQWGNSFMAF